MSLSAISGRCLSRSIRYAWLAIAITSVGCNAVYTSAGPHAVPVLETARLPVETGASIAVNAGGPADTVRKFYMLLRERKFREAVFLTNLRPAVEGLTDSELREFALDFEKIAGRVPTVVEINGEIISGALATVTANLPAEDDDRHQIQTIRLRSDKGIWVILTVAPDAEERIRKEGNSYFYNLKVETHEDEARNMLDRISRAQFAYALQNGGKYGDLQELATLGLLPSDVLTSESTGYNYNIVLHSRGGKYSVSATPAVYGRTGRLSFLLRQDEKGASRGSSLDNRGKPLTGP